MRENEPLISIIVTNYNGKKYLHNCFSSLMEGIYRNFEIIFVDNGSTDDSVRMVRREFPQIKIIEMGHNVGLAIASNRGARVAKGKYLFFLNNDIISDKYILRELVTVAESDKRIGICGCRTMSYDGKNEINTGVACDIFGYPYGDGLPLYVDAGIFMRRTVFDLIHGFDHKLFLYCEDKDLCWRTLLYGYKVAVVKSAIFYHDSFCAINDQGNLVTNVRKRFMGEAFTIRTLLKNYSFVTLTVVFPIYIFINCVEMLLFLFKRRLEVVFGAYIKAYYWNLCNLPDTLRLRKTIQLERRISDADILQRMYRGSGKLRLFKKVGVPRFN